MDSETERSARRCLFAYTVPMAVFLGALALVALLKSIGATAWLKAPEYWLYPLQTLFCAALLVWYWRSYEFHTLRRIALTIGIAVLVFIIWITPQAFLGFAPRDAGFNPDVLAAQPLLYWSTVCLRFLRLVVVVPLVEEIFWRGFLLRYLINERFQEVPFGTFAPLSFVAVTVAFMFAHLPADWVAAAVAGALYNLIAYQTKSLTSCVVAHAITNLLLGSWIMQTKQWGFW